MTWPQAQVDPCESPGGHVWRETDLGPCEVCGDHPGVSCTICYETVDLVFYGDPRLSVSGSPVSDQGA